MTQKAVTAYFSSKQLLIFDFAEWYCHVAQYEYCVKNYLLVRNKITIMDYLDRGLL